MSRAAREREPSGSASTASSRAPASASSTVSRTVAPVVLLDDPQQHEHAEDDRDVRDVERRPPRELDEVGDRAVAHAVDDVADRAAQQHAGRQPHQRLVQVRDEVVDQRGQGAGHQGDDDDPAAREGAEGHAGVADVDQRHRGQDRVLLPHVDAAAHERLGHLVEGDDDRQDEPGAGPDAGPHPWIRLMITLPTSHRTIVAIIGLRSSGPNGGMNRRKIDRYGSLTSLRKSSSDRDQREYGSRPPTLKYMDEKM